MRSHRGPRAAALLIVACLLTPVSGQVPTLPLPELPPPTVFPEIEPAAAADAKSDPLTELMNRVTNLEGELKKAKAAEQAKAAAAGKKPTVNWMMQIQVDGITSSQDAASRAAVGDIPDGAAFRRARFGMYGDHGPWEYRVAMDFALQGRPSFIDVFIALNDVPVLNRVRAGYFFEPLGLERYSQNRFLTFLERSLPAEVLGTPRSLGVMANGNFDNDRGTWAGGVFRTASDFYGDDTGDNFQSAGTGRATYLLWYDEETEGRELLHVGAAYSARGTRNDQVRFRSRPEIRIGAADPNIPAFVDTGNIRSRFYQLLSAELLFIHGPYSVQAEYQLMPVSVIDRGAAYFQSWYVMGSVFLTGENRAYRKRTGVLERIVPRRDFVKKDGVGLAWGPGAWELALRLSHLDLNSGPVSAGRLTDLTFGVNWYMSPYVRMTANYIHAFLTPARGAKGNADFLGLRMGYEF